MDFQDNDHLDRWLNSALQQYGSAEPRAGLEGRVLANLAAEKPLTLRWHWGIAVAGALAICGVLGLWLEGFLPIPHTNKIVAVQAPIEHSDASHLGPQTSEHAIGELRIKSTAAKRNGAKKIKMLELAREPRLDQFPSPRPLSEQERLLAEYVAQFHDKAVLMARAQTKLRNQQQQELVGPPAQDEQLGISE
jgi:hypothetical protein